MKILILTGKFGMGHYSASQSLRLQLLGAFPGSQERFQPQAAAPGRGGANFHMRFGAPLSIGPCTNPSCLDTKKARQTPSLLIYYFVLFTR